jgi:hypothetical protein
LGITAYGNPIRNKSSFTNGFKCSLATILEIATWRIVFRDDDVRLSSPPTNQYLQVVSNEREPGIGEGADTTSPGLYNPSATINNDDDNIGKIQKRLEHNPS